jgi:cobyrinic acid a,c-diamide synthase
MQSVSIPRVVVAGLSGGAGKTLVSLGLSLAARRAGIPVRGFKKGPDYIDTAWLTWASGHPARNLDTYLMGFPGAVASLSAHGCGNGLNIIEGNRGVFDGMDAQGTHSTAALAKALDAPVILVVNATKATRTVAACVLGCQKLDPAVRFAGVVLNSIGTARHERVLRDAIEQVCSIPVFGAIPRLEGCLMPERHLGLVTPAEHPSAVSLERQLVSGVAAFLDLKRILACAGTASPLPCAGPASSGLRPQALTIGYIKDRAFTFYYPENLEALEAAGAKLAPIDSLTAQALPDELDALYIGGGFPETHAGALAGNPAFLRALKAGASRGLPVYAECGGLMLLSRGIRIGGTVHPMAGVLPFEVELSPSPQGHGYVRAKVDRQNPFFAVGLEIKGHEFHYSRVLPCRNAPITACAVERGTGCFEGRDGVISQNVWAGYTHIHALGLPEWAGGLMQAAAMYNAGRSRSSLNLRTL